MPPNNKDKPRHARRQAGANDAQVKADADQDLVREVEALARKGLLHEGLDIAKAVTLARYAVEQADLWGKRYEASESRTFNNKRLTTAAQKLKNELAKITDPRTSSLILKGPHGEPKSLELSALQALANRPFKAKDGRPSDAYVLGFIWGTAVGWRQLTRANIGRSGRFLRFLVAALAVARPDKEPRGLETLIRTAIERSGMKRRKWLAPVGQREPSSQGS